MQTTTRVVNPRTAAFEARRTERTERVSGQGALMRDEANLLARGASKRHTMPTSAALRAYQLGALLQTSRGAARGG